MTCINCQNRIASTLQQTSGITEASVSYETGVAEITYDPEKISMEQIIARINSLDYGASTQNTSKKENIIRAVREIAIIAVIFFLLQRLGILNRLAPGKLADSEMGYAACEKALAGGNPSSGSVGAGTGATVGKICGMERAMKSGLGMYAVQLGELRMAAVVAVNALGDIFDSSTGRKIAGLRTEDGTAFSDSCEELWKMGQRENLFTGNTTIGAVITNGKFNKAQMNKIASMTRNAYARCINPVGTMADGDSIYAASAGEVEADLNVAGTLAAYVMERAIVAAIR